MSTRFSSLAGQAGAVLSAAALASIAAAIPPALRASGASFPLVWAELAGLGLVPMTLVVALFGRVRPGLSLVFGASAETRAFCTFVAGALALPVLVGFGSALRATTHHHGLAGVTFAFGATAVGVTLALAAARISGWMDRLDAKTQRRLVLGGTLATLTVLELFAVRLFRGGLPMVLRARLVDGAAFAVAAVLAAYAVHALFRAAEPVSEENMRSAPIAAPIAAKVLALLAVPLALALLAAGMRGPLDRAALAETAPVHASNARLLGVK